MNRDEILYEQLSELYDIAMENQMPDIQRAKYKDADVEYLNSMLHAGHIYRKPTMNEMNRILSIVKKERAVILSDPKFKQSIKEFVEDYEREYGADGPTYSSYDVKNFFDKNLTIKEGYYIPVVNGPEADQDFCSSNNIAYELIHILKNKYPEFSDFEFSAGDGDEGCLYVERVRVRSLSELSEVEINEYLKKHKADIQREKNSENPFYVAREVHKGMRNVRKGVRTAMHINNKHMWNRLMSSTRKASKSKRK